MLARPPVVGVGLPCCAAWVFAGRDHPYLLGQEEQAFRSSRL
nr:hypothetical protein [Acetobacter persici]